MIIVWLYLVLNGVLPVRHVILAVSKILLVRLSVMNASLVPLVKLTGQQSVLLASVDTIVGMSVSVYVLYYTEQSALLTEKWMYGGILWTL